jgi:FkbM family methyltransferase
MFGKFRPVISRFVRPLSPTHRERDRLVASLSHLFAEPPVFRVPEFSGDFQMDPRSRLFYRLVVSGGYEPELAELVRKHVDKSRDAIDVGANIGFFSCLLAKLLPNQRVLSIEPTQGALKFLRANLERNKVSDQVSVFEGVVTDRSQVVTLAYVEGSEEFSSLGGISHPSATIDDVRAVEVQGEALDDLVDRYGLNPGFMKVDTEGAEALVFKGAQGLLRKFRPVVLSELSAPLLKAKGGSVREVVRQFEDLNYVLVDPLSPSKQVGHRKFGDLLAIPR